MQERYEGTDNGKPTSIPLALVVLAVALLLNYAPLWVIVYLLWRDFP